MADMRQHREPPDLLGKIADLERRLNIVETSRRLGNASIDGGQLTLRGGDLAIVDENENLTMLLSHGAAPAITFIPSSVEGGYSSSQFAWESDSNGATHEIHIENPAGQTDGGKLLLNKDTAYLSHQPNGDNEAFIAVGDIGGGYTEHIRLKGRWFYNAGFGADDAFVCGYDSFGAGFGAASYAFPYTFDTIPIVLFSIFNAGTAVAADLSALSTSGFTVAWATGTTAKTVMWAAFRR